MTLQNALMPALAVGMILAASFGLIGLAVRYGKKLFNLSGR